ncbi:MAG: HNH endonuclease signature motif containing protein [Nitrospirota bacterium]|nr:HNH endonuclease signature motif containing protein [Nitrospirota bacterium]
MMTTERFYDLGDDDAVQRHIKLERDRAKKLRKSPWWKTQIQKGLCHFCQQTVGTDHLTMDHLVPLARGGRSTRGNIVPACHSCNKKKQLETPVETLLNQMAIQPEQQERQGMK